MVVILIFATLILDQLTKFTLRQNFIPHQSIPLIKGVFHLTLVYNRGAAFGMFKNQTFLFIVVSLFALIFIYFDLKNKKSESKIYTVALSLIAAGALGNLIDRIFLGYVVDFLDFRIWPVFNLADSAITIGAILLGFSILKEEKGKKCRNIP